MRFLFTILLGIWGTIAYQIYSPVYSTSDEPAPVSANIGRNKQAHDVKYIYTADVRDPFQFATPAKRDSARKPNLPVKPKQVWQPPLFKLTGILTARKKKTAMLEDPAGGVFFLHEGDTLSGVRILKIGDANVTYLFSKRRSDWLLSNGPR